MGELAFNLIFVGALSLICLLAGLWLLGFVSALVEAFQDKDAGFTIGVIILAFVPLFGTIFCMLKGAGIVVKTMSKREEK